MPQVGLPDRALNPKWASVALTPATGAAAGFQQIQSHLACRLSLMLRAHDSIAYTFTFWKRKSARRPPGMPSRHRLSDLHESYHVSYGINYWLLVWSNIDAAVGETLSSSSVSHSGIR